MENSMEVPSKTKNGATIWHSNSTSGHISRGNHDSKKYMHPNVHWSAAYNSQDVEAKKCPRPDEWIKMCLYTHTHTHTHIHTHTYTHTHTYSQWNIISH